MNYLLHLLIYFCIYATIGIGLNIVVGYCGLLTLAQAAFFALGCYCYALGSLVFHWGMIESLCWCVPLAFLLSLCLSLSAWRLRGDFFVMASLAVQTLLVSGLNNWSSVGHPIGTLQNLTNGPSGLPGIPKPAIFGIAVDTKVSFAAIGMSLLAGAMVVSYVLLRSPWGRALQAMKDDELASRGIGKDVRLLKVQAFAISGIIAASAGIVYASYVGYIDPTLASLDHSILMLAMVIVGGIGSFSGPILGAAMLIAIPEVLRFVQIPDAMAGSVRLLVFGLLLLVLMHVRPQGLRGRLRLD